MFTFPVRCHDHKDSRFEIGDMFIVLEYGDFDLAGLLDSVGVCLSHDHIRSFTYQLLEGVSYMHGQKVLHRDLKPANILITKDNILKIADWNLARECHDSQMNLTPEVITLWYRAPEVCYRTRDYGPEVDIWSVGCIFAELYAKAPIMKGRTDIEQLGLIYTLLGRPTGEIKELFSQYPDWEKTVVQEEIGKSGSKLILIMGDKMKGESINLLGKMLQLDPKSRISADEALTDGYFQKLCCPQMLERFTIVNGHEYERKQHKKKCATDMANQEKTMKETRQLLHHNRPRRPGKFVYIPPFLNPTLKRDNRGMVRPLFSSDIMVVERDKRKISSRSNAWFLSKRMDTTKSKSIMRGMDDYEGHESHSVFFIPTQKFIADR